MIRAADTPDPRALIDEIDALQRRSRDLLAAFWFPLVLFGVLTLASAVFTGGDATGVFWAFAGPIGSVITGVFYARRKVGIDRPARPYVATAAALIVGAFVAAGVAAENWKSPAAMLAVAIGYAVFAALERSWIVVATAVVMAVAATGFGLADAGTSALLPVIVGAILTATGAWLWWTGRES
jgi:hypothetical protein